MKRSYWENMAPKYDHEIFDVLKNDRKKIIRSTLEKIASKNKTVSDIGCAIGKWLPVLSPLFKKVIAIDISAKNLEIAEKKHARLKNIEYLRVDMSKPRSHLPKTNAGICINAILTASIQERNTFFRKLSEGITNGGYIIITVPSLESWLLTSIVQQNWKIDRSLFPKLKNAKEGLEKWNDILQGNVAIDNVRHKHFLKEELELVLGRNGFIAQEFQKIEYNWSTEFHRPPKWLKDPRPWDWMVLAKRKNS